MDILSILWGIIFSNLIVISFNLICTVCMKYGNWAYKLFKRKYTVPIYLGIYVFWITLACRIDLYKLVESM